MLKNLIILVGISCLLSCQSTTEKNKITTIKVATFNVSMEATNYVSRAALKPGEGADVLRKRLKTGDDPQIKNIAEILQRNRPDIVLLNEFDYIKSPQQGVKAFISKYLNKPQNGAKAIDYPYFYYAQTNTGLPTDFDLNNDGKFERYKIDAQGFGFFHGQYGMMLLSKYPIDKSAVRTFQKFLRKDMPDALEPFMPDTGEPFYTDEEWSHLRLSSKSHWDVPVLVDGKVLHVLASHPVPPVFDGPEDSNGARNHDEIRLWTDYISPDDGSYIVDDNGQQGGLAQGSDFVVLGDQNASPVESNARVEGINSLLESPRTNNSFTPQSEGGKQNKADSPHAKHHTAVWGARADYVLPSTDIKVLDGGVFWPVASDPLFRLIDGRQASSDHRLVWLEIQW